MFWLDQSRRFSFLMFWLRFPVAFFASQRDQTTPLLRIWAQLLINKLKASQLVVDARDYRCLRVE